MDRITQITGPCRTEGEAREKLVAWLEMQARAGVVIDLSKITALVGRADWGTFFSFEYDPAKPAPRPRRGPDEPLPLP